MYLLFQHEKYSSQLQMSLKASEGKKTELQDRTKVEKIQSTKTLTQGALQILHRILQIILMFLCVVFSVSALLWDIYI